MASRPRSAWVLSLVNRASVRQLQARYEMNTRSFLKSGHFPTLMAAFLYFDVSFMVWVLLGPLAPFLGEQLHLSATQKGFLTAILLLGWRFAHTPGQFYFLGLLLGIGGASFAVALPLAGCWYPPEYQGLVMGIAG